MQSVSIALLSSVCRFVLGLKRRPIKNPDWLTANRGFIYSLQAVWRFAGTANFQYLAGDTRLLTKIAKAIPPEIHTRTSNQISNDLFGLSGLL